MIQQLDARQHHPLHARNDAPEVWGQWSGRKHYSLEVVQHPLRARMCGFGDKDRRPLAPAAVAKMIVKRDDDSIVDVDEVDCSFFLVTVDLWSADGTQEMNLVLHPSSTDRYVPQQSVSKPKRKANPSGGRTTPTPSQRPGDQTGNSTPSLSAHAPYGNQTYFPPQDSVAYPQPAPYAPVPHDPAASWGYAPPAPPPTVDRSASFPPPILPSIHAFARTNSTASSAPDTPWSAESAPEPEIMPYRPWGTDPAYAQVDQAVDPALRGPPVAQPQDTREWAPYTAPPPPPPPPPPPAEEQQQQYVHVPYQQPSFTQYPPQAVPPSPAPSHTHAPTSVPVPRHTYTRTLVGPLSANACRLLDEHRKPGIFFLFQDLSVRTEGSFRLRMRLMNVGAPPAPEMGAQQVHNNVSPVLAQTFTEPFTVYSAKRFPGVPDTTALSIAFGNQGQKLPLRNRHGSSKRRRRGDSSDEDSE